MPDHAGDRGAANPDEEPHDHLHIKHVRSYLADTFRPPRSARPSRTYQTVLVGRAPGRGADQGWIITGRRGAGCAARWRGRYVQQQSTAAPVTLSDALRRSAQHDWDVHGSAIRLRKVRDEEAVGSNPATPTQQIRALQHAQGSISCAETAMYSSGSTAACLFGEVSARVPCWTATSPPWAREAALARDRPRTCCGTRCHPRVGRACRCSRSCSMCRAGALTQTHQCASARRARSAAG
jgi:hypothetical protein